MTIASTPSLPVLGLFEKRFAGDDCLLELARWRFREAGMGAEMHAGSLDQLEHLLAFRPSDQLPVVLHLPRDFNLVDETCRSRIGAFAQRFAGRVRGLVIHDHRAMAARPDDYVAAARDAQQRLAAIPHGPILYVEYAAGISLGDFVAFFTAIRDLDRVSACIDIGHVAMRHAAEVLESRQTPRDPAAIRKQVRAVPEVKEAVDAAGRAGVVATMDLIEAMVGLKKPLHYHLHDGHPLSTASPYGVWDHLSFLAEVPVAWGGGEPPTVSPVFGPIGLAQVIRAAVAVPSDPAPSFTLEIHPTGEERDLCDAPPLFGHWVVTTHARQMHHWVTLLLQNHRLLQQALHDALHPITTCNAAPENSRRLPRGLDPVDHAP